jgi:Fe-S-cluster containining protein
VHLDNRVRLWDINDGRCFNISSHNIFGGNEMTGILPLKPNLCRIFIFYGKNKKIYKKILKRFYYKNKEKYIN